MSIKLRKFQLFFIIWILIFAPLLLNAEILVKTPAEASNYTEYSQYEEISQFLSRIDDLSKEVVVKIASRTLNGENYNSEDLYLCIITENGAENPEELDRNKPTFYLIASKHGNEQSAKEAALRLIKDLAVGELKPLLKHINFLILPAANPFGNRENQRRNEQGLDLNRDQVKLESPESEVINRVFRIWMPEVTMDVHEKGYDYYQVNIGCVSNANIHKSIQTFSRNSILTEVKRALAKKKITFHEYLVTQKMGIDSSAGVTYATQEMEGGERMKRFSTTDLNDGRNSPGIYETISFIQEGASLHDLKSLKERTEYQYYGIRFTAESVARHGGEIIALVRQLRQELLKKAKVFSKDDLIHLRMKYARDKKHPTLTIKKFESNLPRILGILKTDKKAGDTLAVTDIKPIPMPPDYKVVEEVVKNWFPRVEPVISVSRPLGYIIPAAHRSVIETLCRHSLNLEYFSRDFQVEAEIYQVVNVEPAEYDYLPPQKIEVERKNIKRIAKEGDIYISCAQPGANLIPCLLEPQSQYGFIRYWKFQLAPETGEFYPFCRIVKAQKLPLVPYKNWGR